MIRYGCAIASERKYERFARRGVSLVAAAGSPVLELRGRDSLFSAYNEILDAVADDSEAEALVLLHEDTEIRDPAFEAKVRGGLASDDVAIVGVLGAIGVQDIDWWVHERLVGSAELRVLKPLETYGSSLVRPHPRRVGDPGGGEVDMVDGFLLAVSPWVIANLRFDESLGAGFHGYDVDICFQARELGKRIIVIETDVAHHQDTLGPGGSRAAWKQAHVAFRRKWERRWPLALPPWSPPDDLLWSE